jgi:homoserine kinase
VISVRVPATSANLGPGYDAVGLALTLSMRIGLERSPYPAVEVRGTGAELIPRGPEHPAYRAARFVAELVGESDVHFRLVQENAIPPTRGLGGSAAALVGGAVAANDLFGGQIAAPDLLNIVCELDGHPDNAAPAMLGGLVIGLIETFWSAYFSIEYKDVAAFSILAITLIFLPSGLLGRPEVEKL